MPHIITFAGESFTPPTVRRLFGEKPEQLSTEFRKIRYFTETGYNPTEKFDELSEKKSPEIKFIQIKIHFRSE